MEIPDVKSILLHVCCAPCSGPIVERLVRRGLSPTIFFYNPNVHPQEEYEARKKSMIDFANRKGLQFVDADYDPAAWIERVRLLEHEPEGGRRCSLCFDIRLEKTALYANENGFQYFATTNGIARWKNLGQVNESGIRAASRYRNLHFLAINWRLNGGQQEINSIAQRENFYRQQYCGCLYSLKSTNDRRRSKGLPPVGKSELD